MARNKPYRKAGSGCRPCGYCDHKVADHKRTSHSEEKPGACWVPDCGCPRYIQGGYNKRVSAGLIERSLRRQFKGSRTHEKGFNAF